MFIIFATALPGFRACFAARRTPHDGSGLQYEHPYDGLPGFRACFAARRTPHD